MEIMGYRQQELDRALEGLRQTNVPLVSANGKLWQPSGNGDDVGIYYYVPKVAQWLDIGTPLALDVFYYTIMALAFVVATLGVLMYFRTVAGRAVAFAWLASTVCMMSPWNDVYLIAPCLALALVPLLLWLLACPRHVAVLITIGLLAGVSIGAGNLVRSHAGTGLALFALLLGTTATALSWRQRASFVAALLVGIVVPQVHFQYLVHQRDAFLTQHVEDYEPGGVRHAFWHPVYLGLGFLRNPYGLEWDDSAAMKAADAVSPGVVYLSEEYSQALKKQVIGIYHRDRVFVYRTIFAKAGITFYYVLRYAGLGLLAAVFRPKHWGCELAFAVGIGFSALPGVIGIPDEIYLVGLMAFASMYSAMSVGLAVDRCILAIPTSRWASTSWVAARPWLVRTAILAPSLILVVVCARVGGKKLDRTYHTISRFVEQSLDASQTGAVMAFVVESAFADLIDSEHLEWKRTNDNVSFRHEQGLICLTTDDVVSGYQAEATVEMNEAEALYLTYEIELEEGAIALGVLNSRGEWSKQVQFAKPGLYRSAVAVSASRDPVVKLIFSNASQSGVSRCRIRELRVGLCDLDAKPAEMARTGASLR